MKRRALAGAVALVLAGGLAAGGIVAGCGRDRAPPVDRLVIAGGVAGSVYDALAHALADEIRERWAITVDVRTTGGPIDNLTRVGGREADIGFATVDLAHLATQGDPPFLGPQPINALAGLYEDFLHVVTPSAMDIGQLSDLAGLRVSLGSRESGTQVVAERAFLAAGHDLPDFSEVQYLTTRDSAEALRAGRIDAFFMVGGLPTPALQDLAGRMPLRLISVPEEEEDLLQDQAGEYYHRRSIPAGTYQAEVDDESEGDVATVGIPNVLFVRQGMEERVVYALTELLFAAKERLVAAHREARRLDPRSALAVFPLPLHPGARRYYQESKPMAAPRR